MKFEAYERPDLEELELILEGSFLDHKTGDPNTPDVPIDGGENDGGENEWN